MMNVIRSLLPSSSAWSIATLCVIALSGCASSGLPQLHAGTLASADMVAGREVVRLPQPDRPFAVSDLFGAAGETAVAETDANLYDVVTVYWGTDRKLPVAQTSTADIVTSAGTSARSEASATSGAGSAGGDARIRRIALPGAERGHRLALGRAHVTVPKIARDKGTIQRPWQITFLDYTLYKADEDPRQHFTVGDIAALDADTFVAEADRHLSRAERFKDQAFVFVHGFNTSFDEALYRTAQIAYDLEFDGVPYMYSWPSQGSEQGYIYDRDSADRARRYFLEFLTFVAEKTKAKRIHVIAHSLGIRPVGEALQMAKLSGRSQDDLKIDQIILAAPDIDRDVFAEIAATLMGTSSGTTLYAASNDRALMASRTLALGKPRAGEVTADGPMIVKGIDTIDISEAGSDGWFAFNHATYADSSHLLTDLRLLLRSGLRPPDRRFPVYRLREVAGLGRYWQYVRN